MPYFFASRYFGSCVPDEACAGSNQCKKGYRWYQSKCQAHYDKVGNVTCRSDLDCDPDPDSECTGTNPEACSYCDKKPADNTGYCRCNDGASRCSLCTVGTHYRMNGKCQRCPDNPELVIAAFVSALFICGCGSYVLNKKKFNVAFITIGWDYFQVLALFSTIEITWPPLVLDFLDVLKFFSFNIDIAAPECLTPDVTYELKWFLMMVIPATVTVVLIVMFYVIYAVKKIRGERRKRFLNEHSHVMYAVFYLMMYYLYLPLTIKAVEVLNCSELEVDDGYTYTAWTSPSCSGGLCKCWQWDSDDGDGTQANLASYAFCALGLYTICYPILVMRILWKNWDKIQVDQILRAMGTGDDHITNPEAYWVRTRYHKLYYHFKPGRTYWITVILARKFWLGVAALIFADSPSFCLAFVLMVLFSNYVFHVLKRPFMSSVEQAAAVEEHDALVADHIAREQAEGKLGPITREGRRAYKVKLLLDRVGYVAGADRTKGAENARLSVIRREALQRSREGEVTKEFFFDFNTVESLLLASAILVCVFGIMFEAPVNGSDNIWDYSLGVLTVLVISFSLFYYFVVFTSEVFTVLGIENAKFLQRLMKLTATRGKGGDKRVDGSLVEMDEEGTGGGGGDTMNALHAGAFEMQMAHLEYNDKIDWAKGDAILKDQRIEQLLADQRLMKQRQARMHALDVGRERDMVMISTAAMRGRAASSSAGARAEEGGEAGEAGEAAARVSVVGTRTSVVGQWEVYEEEGTGTAYYHNPTTNETTWEKPKELEKPPVGAAKKAAAASSATESGQTGGAALSVRAAAKAREARNGPKKTKKKGIGYKSRMKELSSPDAQIDNDML